MKKLFCLLLVALVLSSKGNGQSLQYSLRYNSTNNNFEVYVIPTGFGVSSINIGPSQATVVFEGPSNVVNGTSIATTAVNGGPWTDQDYVSSPSAVYVGFQTTGATTSITNGSPTLLFTFNVSAVGGNCNGRLRLFVNSTDNPDPTSVGADFTSYLGVISFSDFLSTNTDATFRTCTQLVPLPVKFLGFTVRRNGDKAMLDWTVAGEDERTSYYEILKSVDGLNFTKIDQLHARKKNELQQYSFEDGSLSSLNVKKIYYRIKQVDVDGKFVYTNIGVLDLTNPKQETALYPNPAKDGFVLAMPYTNSIQSRIQLQLVSSLGQIIERKDISRQAATNYYYNLQSSLITSGEYLLKIFEDGQLTETKRVLIKK